MNYNLIIFRALWTWLSKITTFGPIIPKNQKELTIDDIPTLKNIDALVIAKPRKAFTDGEKVILDQYIMNQGKTLWMIDAVNAEMDTLYQSKKIMAYPTDLNMTDFSSIMAFASTQALVRIWKNLPY